MRKSGKIAGPGLEGDMLRYRGYRWPTRNRPSKRIASMRDVVTKIFTCVISGEKLKNFELAMLVNKVSS